MHLRRSVRANQPCHGGGRICWGVDVGGIGGANVPVRLPSAVLAALLVTAPVLAQAHLLCRVAYRTRDDLWVSITGKPDAKVWHEHDTATVFREHSLWWFTTPRNRAYPAVACIQRFTMASGGYAHLPVQADCGGGPHLACVALARDLSKAKW
jgi:hypothetical protein